MKTIKGILDRYDGKRTITDTSYLLVQKTDKIASCLVNKLDENDYAISIRAESFFIEGYGGVLFYEDMVQNLEKWLEMCKFKKMTNVIDNDKC